jgi:NitT/TauT family transport system substrate-binding protein
MADMRARYAAYAFLPLGAMALLLATYTPSASQGAKTKVTIGWTSQDATYASLWVAKEEGIFDKYGLTVEPVFTEGSTKAVQMLLAGQIDLAYPGGPAIVSARLNGAPVVVLASTLNKLVGEVWTAKDISRPDQLKGKTWGTSGVGTETDFLARAALRKWGLRPDQDVTIIQVGFSAARLAALQNGTIQVASLYAPFISSAKTMGLNKLANHEDLVGEYLSAGLTATEQYVRTHREVLGRFIRANWEGARLYQTNRDVGVKAIAKYLQLTDKPQVAAEGYDVFVSTVPHKLMPTERAVQTVLDLLPDPKAKAARATDFLALDIIKGLDQKGLLGQ